MSHFSVLVVLEERPTDENQLLEKALQPFHEYECTGVDDEYVIWVDCHDEVEEGWNENVDVWVKGEQMHSRYDDVFYRDPTAEEKPKIGGGTGLSAGIMYTSRDWNDGKGYRAKVIMDDDERYALGFVKKQMPRKHAGEYDCIEAFAKGYHGYDEIKNGRIGRKTNPNKQWDWWVVGGRWQGFLKVKKGSSSLVGKAGLMGSSSGRGGVDGCYISDLDVDQMKSDAVAERRSQIDKILQKSGLDQANLETAIRTKAVLHKEWMELSEPKPRGSDYYEWCAAQSDQGRLVEAAAKGIMWDWPEIGDMTIESWIAAAPPLQTFAVLKNGEWHERGSMGWWGIVSDKNPNWEEAFEKLFLNLSGDQWITIVDCHI